MDEISKTRYKPILRRRGLRGKGLIFFSSVLFLLVFSFQANAQQNTQQCGCDICHGNPPTLDNTYGGPNGLVITPLTGETSAGAHAIHVPILTGANQNPRCYVCHADGMPYTPLCGDSNLYIGFGVNGNNPTYDGIPLSSAYTYSGTNGLTITTNGTQVCSNIYCHSNATGGTFNVAPSGPAPLTDPRPVAVPSSSPSWTYSGTLGCTGCHGYPPSYPTDSPKANSHLFAPHEQTCDFCHFATTADGVTITTPTFHANGYYDLVPNSAETYLGTAVTFSYAYDPGGGICTNVSCHPAGQTHIWGNIYESVSPIYPVYGPNCYEVTINNIQFASPTEPPYSYTWSYGDGNFVSGTNLMAALPIIHMYGGPGPYTALLTGRDSGSHPFTTAVNITPQSVDIPPVVNVSLSLNYYTLTINDESYSPDCNNGACSNTGPGTININWNGNNMPQTISNVNLCSPTGLQISHTYAASGNYKIVYSVTDNAGGVSTYTTTTTVPGQFTVSGTITHASGAPYSGITVYLFKTGTTSGALASATTNASGFYSISRSWTTPCFDVEPIWTGSGTVTFTPTKASDICVAGTTQNFTASN